MTSAGEQRMWSDIHRMTVALERVAKALEDLNTKIPTPPQEEK